MNFLHIIAQITKQQVEIPKTELTQTNITNILQFVFGLAGAIALIIVVIGGFNFATSQGNPEKTLKARNTIIYAILGLVVCITAFSIVTFVVGRI